MKTQVIHLDPHDDLISIRDRMAWAKTPRILLVWPKRGHVGVRPLDLTLLRRHAEALGAELGIVTRNGEIRAAARELGIPFFLHPPPPRKSSGLSAALRILCAVFHAVICALCSRDYPAQNYFLLMEARLSGVCFCFGGAGCISGHAGFYPFGGCAHLVAGTEAKP